ncbi:hypothetical protein O181_037903 [Austropuccinia psidii MF-1]|uniref:Uncharacterized protein n=1 Tax=Austropuccinia psidii MF-1 TaxID=1389203 RepID=A0A9Q3HAJ5_9BASI|nr:hypothetical protein [Austropuccinia psidii MF-1]
MGYFIFRRQRSLNNIAKAVCLKLPDNDDFGEQNPCSSRMLSSPHGSTPTLRIYPPCMPRGPLPCSSSAFLILMHAPMALRARSRPSLSRSTNGASSPAWSIFHSLIGWIWIVGGPWPAGLLDPAPVQTLVLGRPALWLALEELPRIPRVIRTPDGLRGLPGAVPPSLGLVGSVIRIL